jgi:hypothetical protein
MKMSYVEVYGLGRVIVHMLFSQQLAPAVVARKLMRTVILVPESNNLLLEWLLYPRLSHNTKARLRHIITELCKSVRRPEISEVAEKEDVVTTNKGLSHPIDVHEMAEVLAIHQREQLKQVIILRRSLAKASSKFKDEGLPVVVVKSEENVKSLLGL